MKGGTRKDSRLLGHVLFPDLGTTYIGVFSLYKKVHLVIHLEFCTFSVIL